MFPRYVYGARAATVVERYTGIGAQHASVRGKDRVHLRVSQETGSHEPPEPPDTTDFGCIPRGGPSCLDHGANPNARASLRKRLRFVPDESMHEYRDVTPLSWGERFHDPDWVNRSAMLLIAERGGEI